jgi:hypothetical protein
MPSIDDILDQMTPGEIVSAIILSRKGYRFTEESLTYGFRKAAEQYPRLASIDQEAVYNILYTFQSGSLIILSGDCKNLYMPDTMHKTVSDVLSEKCNMPDILDKIEPVANSVWTYEGQYVSVKK